MQADLRQEENEIARSYLGGSGNIGSRALACCQLFLLFLFLWSGIPAHPNGSVHFQGGSPWLSECFLETRPTHT